MEKINKIIIEEMKKSENLNKNRNYYNNSTLQKDIGSKKYIFLQNLNFDLWELMRTQPLSLQCFYKAGKEKGQEEQEEK